MKESINQELPKNPQRANIAAAKIVADVVRSTLGPKGMDKLLLDSHNEVVITNDGVTILSEMEIAHPIARMIVEIAQTQDLEVGDGTTTAVILAGELLHNAEELLDKKIHPTIITKGYRLAALEAQRILEEKSFSVSSDESTLNKIVTTAMTGKGAEVAKDHLAQIVVAAAKRARNREDVAVTKKVGGSIEDSKVVRGLILEKSRVHPDMPETISNGKIAILNGALEVRDTETDAKISITNPQQMQAFLDQEEAIIKSLVDRIIASGANVVFCQKGIDDLAQYFLAKAGILAVRRIKQSEMKQLAQATGAKIIFDLKDLSVNSLGSADVAEITEHGEPFIHITNMKNDVISTILVQGGTSHVAEETVRAIEDALGDVFSILKSGKAVAGAGAIEIELAQELQKYAQTLSGREQLAVQAFAQSLEVVPRTLSENAGLDPIDVLTSLYAAHEKGMSSYGVDVFTGKIVDAVALGVIEPINVKKQALQSASEVANMILRIDDIIATQPEPQRPRVRFPENMNLD